MKTRIILVFSLVITFNIHSQNIGGSWNWEYGNGKHVSEIILNTNDNINYSGYYCSAYYQGKTIDCASKSEICISVTKINENLFTGTFNSPTYDGEGSIKITYLPSEDKIMLEITNSSGEFYLPDNAKFQ